MKIKIEQLTSFHSGITQMINDLLMQLNPDSKTLGDNDIKEIIKGESNYFFVAREPFDNRIVGMLTLIIYRIPFSKKAWLEDIVVDENYRKKGIATKLIDYAVVAAKNQGVSSLNLTSQSKKEDANRLYQHLGFEKRDTNLYWMKL